MFENAEIIHAYTRADAIADGDLVDVSETATESGFTVPVALTRAAWEDCVAWDEADNKRKHTVQDEAGRLWDVLWIASLAIRRTVARHANACGFAVLRVPREGRGHLPRRAYLKIAITGGDDGEPVITIMLPGED